MSLKSSSPEQFRIVDRDPKLIRRAADRAVGLAVRAGLVKFDPQLIMSIAQKSTRLSDLRPVEVEEPLALMCDDISNNPPTPLGRAMMFSILTQAMSSRRRLQHANAPARPEKPPVVIMGWYRTGTTYLQTLLGALPTTAFVPLHQLIDPVPVPGSRVMAEVSSRWAHYLEPDLRRLHHTHAMSPEECWLLLGQHLILDGMTYMYPLPTYREWLEEADRLPAYETWARALALLERRQRARLIMKDPAHMRGLREIMTVTPEATLVWTHRDPRSAVASHASLVAVQHRLMYGDLAAHTTGRECVDGIARYYESALAARKEIGESAFVDIHFEDLKSDPVGCVERICDHAGIPFDAAAVEAEIDRQSRDRKPRHVRDLSQWGIDPDEIAEFY